MDRWLQWTQRAFLRTHRRSSSCCWNIWNQEESLLLCNTRWSCGWVSHSVWGSPECAHRVDSSQLHATSSVFTSHVLMCADSHSWRTKSSCSMLDRYCFSGGKTGTIATHFVMHSCYFSIIVTDIWVPRWKQEVNIPTNPRLFQRNQRPNIYIFVLTSLLCSFSTLFGFGVHLIWRKKGISLIPGIYTF